MICFDVTFNWFVFVVKWFVVQTQNVNISIYGNQGKKLNFKNKHFKKNIIFCTLLLSGNTEIKNLNKKFRKKNKSTDVLSFPIKSYFNKNYKGDIAICYEIINLRSKKTNFNYKIYFSRFLTRDGLVASTNVKTLKRWKTGFAFCQ